MHRITVRRSAALLSAAALIAVATVLVSAAPAGAASSVKVAFMAQMDISGNGYLINSSVPGCPAATVNSSEITFFFRGAVGHFAGKHGFDCGGGNTFTVSFIAHRAGGAVTNTGSWKVVDGTGSFVGMSGSGTLLGGGTPGQSTFVDVYTGTLNLP